MEAVSSIGLDTPGVPSVILRDLSEYATLPFLAAFDVPDPSLSASASKKPMVATSKQKRITYISMSKKCMPMLVELFLRFKHKAEVYVDGTLEAVLSAYSIPIKLKYDCPPPSKFGKDPPLWKTATTSFLRIVREIATQVQSFGSGQLEVSSQS